MGDYPFVQARWYRQGGNEPVSRIVIHDAEYPEKLSAAEDIAKYFQRVERKASAHYCADADSVVQCVLEADGAYHAPPNAHSIGIELAGYAKQTTADWLDAYGTAMLRDHAAPLVAELCARHSIPIRWLTVEQVVAGWHGVTSHNNVSLAFHQSTHTDPGGNFPIDQFMAWVLDAADPQPHPQPVEDNDVPLIIHCVGDDNPDEGANFVLVGNQLRPVNGDQNNQWHNSGFHEHDMEAQAWAQLQDMVHRVG